MKKILSLILVVISTFIVFSGCTDNNVAVGVSSVAFVSKEIEAEFYEEKELKFKVYPSNAKYKNVTYTVSGQTTDSKFLLPNNISTEKLNQGILRIDKPVTTPPTSGSVTITVNVDGKTSTCTAKLKPVLSGIKFADADNEISIEPNSYSYLKLNETDSAGKPVTEMGSDGKPVNKVVDLNKYNVEFKIVDSDDKKIDDIEIIDKHLGLIFCKELASKRTVKIYATLKYNYNEIQTKDPITVNILPSVATDMFVNLGGEALSNNGEIKTFNVKDVTTVDLKLFVKLTNSAQQVVDQQYDVIILNSNSVTYDKTTGLVKITKGIDKNVSFTLQIQTKTASGNNTILQTFNIKITR